MRILITGASGLLGAHLVAGLGDRHEIVGIDRHPWWGDAPADIRVGELSDPVFTRGIIQSFSPEVIIHCAAMAHVDACEEDPARAHAANAELTGRLADAAGNGCLFVYISTDGIFDGRRPFASEDDPPMPVTVYGRTKLAGEREAQKRAARHLIVRTNFYGWSSGRKKTFAEWLVRALGEKQEITLFDDFYFTPLYVVDFVERLRVLIETGRSGLLHLAGGERVSKSQFGFQLAQWAGLSTSAVRVGSLQSAHWVAPRPRDMSLGCDRFVRMTGLSLPGLEEGLRRFLQDKGKGLSQRLRLKEAPRGLPSVAAPRPSGQRSRAAESTGSRVP